MKKQTLTGLPSTGNWGRAIVALLDDQFKTAFTEFANVTFIEKYEVATNIYRYIYEIDGLDRYYVTIENQSTNNYYIYVKLYLKDKVYNTNDYLFRLEGRLKGTISSNYYVTYADLYTLSKDNVLQAFMFNDTSWSMDKMMVFVVQDSDGYVINTQYSTPEIYSNNTGIKYYLNTNENPTFTANEKALKKKALITEDTQTTAVYYDIFESVFFFINTQFTTMTLACIDVEGIKYRQITGKCIFIEDGDTE